MKFLLDTCVLLWSISGNFNKIKPFLPILENKKNFVGVSIISYWEIIIKKNLGKLTVPDNLIELIEKTGYAWINLELRHIQSLEKLPMIHADPFDRLLIAQAQSEKFQLLTTDSQIIQYKAQAPSIFDNHIL